eukprot:8144939-Prorocentrum_lima.AAC.1
MTSSLVGSEMCIRDRLRVNLSRGLAASRRSLMRALEHVLGVEPRRQWPMANCSRAAGRLARAVAAT